MSSSITPITPRQVTDLGTGLQRRLSFALATLTKEVATVLSERPHLFDEWALTWLRFRAHGVKVFVDCASEQQEAVDRVLRTTPGVYPVNNLCWATLVIVGNNKRLTQYLCCDVRTVDAFFVCIGLCQSSPWVLRTVVSDGIENGLVSFFKWLRDILPPDPTRE